MTSEFIREKMRARGSLTPTERELLTDLRRLWTMRVARTEPLDPKKIIPAIKAIYAAAGLKRPCIAVAASPLALAFAYGAAAAVCQVRNQQPKKPAGPGKPGTVEAALHSMTSVVSQGEGASEAVDAATRTDESVSSRFEWSPDLTEAETHVAVGSEPYQSYRGETLFRDSPLYREVRQSFGFAWWSGQSPIRAVDSITSRRISVRRARELRHALETINDAQPISDANGAANHATLLAADAILAAGRNAHGRLVRQPSMDEIELLAEQACHAIAGQGGLSMARKWHREGESIAFVILTDGMENASHEYSTDDVKKLLDSRQKDKNWLVIYLGANQDAFAEGAARGFHESRILNFMTANVADTMRAASRSSLDYGASGILAKAAFTDDERVLAMTSSPKNSDRNGKQRGAKRR